MEPPRTSSYYIEQVEREKKRMLNEISDTDNNSTPYPDTDEDELDGTSVATFEKVSLEVQVLLGQVKKLSKNAEAREKKRAFAIKNLKMDMRLVRDTLANTKPIQIIWPIRDLEKFKELDENIEMNSIHADQLVIFFFKLFIILEIIPPSSYFSDCLLSKFARISRPAKTVFVRDPPGIFSFRKGQKNCD